MSKKSVTLITSGPPLSPSQASCPPSSEPAQTKLELIQCFFPDLLQDIRKDVNRIGVQKYNILNLQKHQNAVDIGENWQSGFFERRRSSSAWFCCSPTSDETDLQEMVIFSNYQFICTFSLPGLPVGCYAVEDILEECWAGTPEALQPSSAKRCHSRASCCRSQGGRWPCPTLSRCGRQARSRYIDGGHQVVTSGCLYLRPWQTENKNSLQVK